METVWITSGLDSQQVGSAGGHIPGLPGSWAPNVKHSTKNTEHGLNSESRGSHGPWQVSKSCKGHRHHIDTCPDSGITSEVQKHVHSITACKQTWDPSARAQMIPSHHNSTQSTAAEVPKAALLHVSCLYRQGSEETAAHSYSASQEASTPRPSKDSKDNVDSGNQYFILNVLGLAQPMAA